MYRKTVAMTLGILATSMASLAQTNTVSYGPAGDRAGPLFGMSFTIDTHSSDTVMLNRVSFRHTDRHTGLGTATAYLHLYDAFATDAQYNPAAIGNLVSVSTNTVDFAQAEADSQLTWYFTNTELDPAKEYFYIFSTNTKAATPDDYSNLTTSAFRLDTGNPYPGGSVWRAHSPWGSPSTDWDMEFEAAWMPKPEPAPASALKKLPTFGSVIIIGGIGLLLIRGRCRR